MRVEQRWHCNRCMSVDKGNTARACTQCGTDTVLIPVTVVLGGDGSYRIAVDPSRLSGADLRDYMNMTQEPAPTEGERSA